MQANSLLHGNLPHLDAGVGHSCMTLTEERPSAEETAKINPVRVTVKTQDVAVPL